MKKRTMLACATESNSAVNTCSQPHNKISRTVQLSLSVYIHYDSFTIFNIWRVLSESSWKWKSIKGKEQIAIDKMKVENEPVCWEKRKTAVFNMANFFVMSNKQNAVVNLFRAAYTQYINTGYIAWGSPLFLSFRDIKMRNVKLSSLQV